MTNTSSDSEKPLFRPEVAAARSAPRLGKVLIHQPLSHHLTALLATGLILLVTAYAYFGTYTRKASVNGLLMPEQGILRLNAQSAGTVKEVLASEGQQVSAGDSLFAISGERLSEAGATQELIAEQLRQRLILLERNKHLARERLAGQQRMLDMRLATITDELKHVREEARLLARREELSKAHLARQQELVDAGFIAIALLQQGEAELLALQGQRQALQRTRTGLERERVSLLAQKEEVDLQQRREMSELDSAMAQVRQEQAENHARTELISTAPFTGILTGVNVQPGQQLAAGSLLASLIPQDATLTAHLYATPRQAGFIESGQVVLMRYAAYPYQKFGMARGRVIEVAKSPYAAQELPPHIASAAQGAGKPLELFYRVTVRLDSQNILVYGHPQQLQAGMLLEADILQDRRRLYEWALEPLYSVTGKMPD